MKLSQKGFSSVLILIGLVLVIGVGAGVYLVNQRIGLFPNPGFKVISSQLCYISLQYPDNLVGKATDKAGDGCILIVQLPNSNNNSFVLASVPDKTWKQVVDNYKKAQNEGLGNVHNINLAGTDGIKHYSADLGEIIYFHKGNLVFQTYCYYSPNDNQTKSICENIVSSIKLFGKSEDYTNISFITDPKVQQNRIYDAKVKHDLSDTKIVINLYKEDNGVYPNTLQAIIDKGYLTVLPTNPYTNKPYSYQSDGNTYTLSGSLGDGTPYQVTDKNSNP